MHWIQGLTFPSQEIKGKFIPSDLNASASSVSMYQYMEDQMFAKPFDGRCLLHGLLINVSQLVLYNYITGMCGHKGHNKWLQLWIFGSLSATKLHRHQAILLASQVKYCNTKSIIGNVNINYLTISSFVIFVL